LCLMSVSFDRRDCWIFDMDGTLTVSIHDFDSIKRILGLPITSRRGYANVEIEIDRDPKLNRSSIPATHTPRQFQKTQF
jgi:phosphoserine phosphatase